MKLFLFYCLIIFTILLAGGTHFASADYVPTQNDLIKIKNDKAVYYIGSDGKRHLFVNEVTFWTWYTGTWDDQDIKIISQKDFDKLQIGKNVTARPGINLIKFENSDKIYAVISSGVIKKVASSDDDSIARENYGENYLNMVIVIQNGFESDYIKSESNNSYLNTYYISNHGDDNNNGLSLDSPIKSISKLNSIKLKAGDRVLFQKGSVWNEEIKINISGEKEKFIVYDSYGSGDKPVIDLVNTTNKECIYLNEVEHINIKNIVCKNVKSTYAIGALNVNDIILDGVEVIDNPKVFSAIYFLTNKIGRGKNNIVKNSTISNNGNDVLGEGIGIGFEGGSNNYIYNNIVSFNDYGIAVGKSSSNNTISYNKVFKNNGAGIHGGSDIFSNVIEHNLVYENSQLIDDTCGIDLLWIGDNNIIRYNEVYSQYDTKNNPDGHKVITNPGTGSETFYGSCGVRFDGGHIVGSNFGTASGNKAYYNVVYNEFMGFQIFNHNNIELYNNTVYNLKKYALEILSASGQTISGINIKNNIFHTAVDGYIYYMGMAKADISNNIYYSNGDVLFYYYNNDENRYSSENIKNYESWKKIILNDSNKKDYNSIIGNPGFINASNPPLDFSLNENSIGINSGVDVGLIKDFDNKDINETVDIGAFEFYPQKENLINERPDYYIESVFEDMDLSLRYIDKPLLLRSRIGNKGNIGSTQDNFKISWYVAKSFIGYEPFGWEKIAETSINGFEPGDSILDSSLAWVPRMPQKYFLKLVIDEDNKINELNENNNEIEKWVTINNPNTSGGAITTNSTALKNIIIFIGDGMGSEHAKATSIYKTGSEDSLSFENFTHTAEVTTAAANWPITDSAAAASAIATGQKVNVYAVSVALPGSGSDLQTLLEYYKAQGKSTGLITNMFMTDATVAAFGAHVADRSSTSQIASDYLNESKPNILLGGGGNGITPASAENAGYTVVTNKSELSSIDTSSVSMLSGQFGDGNLPYEYDGLGSLPSLSDMTTVALDILDNDSDGFFAVIEGGLIDNASHSNDLARMINETLEFENAIDVVHSWASSRDDTLIIVTADHETGGLTVTQNNGVGVYPTVSWSSDTHTATNVYNYAWGNGADEFTGTFDNTAYYNKITQ